MKILSLPKQESKLYIRNFIFGVEDSLVSTVGLISGIAVAGSPKPTILLTGIILIFVEAFSMGAGSLISEHSSEEYTQGKHSSKPSHLWGALIMLVSYFTAGFMPLLPYLITSPENAFWISILCALTALFLLGVINAKIFKIKILNHSLEILLIGGLAIIVGVTVGKLVKFM